MPVADTSSSLADRLPADDASIALVAAWGLAAQTTADLFMPEAARLRDDDRVEIAGSLAALVDEIEQDLRARLGEALPDRPALSAALAARHMPIARAILDRADALRDADLVATLVRLAMQRRLAARLLRQRDLSRLLDPDAAPSPALEEDGDPAVFVAARARRHAAGAPILSAEQRHHLVWRVAAALRGYLIATHGVPAALADAAIARSAEAALAGYDEGATPPARALTLARALRAAGRLDETVPGAALGEGDVPLAIAALAVRAGIGFDPAWDMMRDPARLLPLCRAADLGTRAAATIALLLDPGDDDEALADRLEGYPALPPEQAAGAIGLWRCDPAYRESILMLGGARRP